MNEVKHCVLCGALILEGIICKSCANFEKQVDEMDREL